MAIIEVEITDENKVEFIKQLLKDYGLSEVESNIFVDKKKGEDVTKKLLKKKKKSEI